LTVADRDRDRPNRGVCLSGIRCGHGACF
jgi:hypothetical protein